MSILGFFAQLPKKVYFGKMSLHNCLMYKYL